MRTSITSILSAGLMAGLLMGAAQTASAAVPTRVTITGEVTAISATHIEIDGVSYALEPGSALGVTVANVHRGQHVSVELTAVPEGQAHSTTRGSGQETVVTHSSVGARSLVHRIHAS
jgi:F420-0:gamma-glutamyl ligase-like protein